MRVTIVVQPEQLRQAAATVRALGGRALEVRGQLGATVAGLGPALGDGRARPAFAELWTRWSASSERLAGSVADLAAALEAAAARYQRADVDGGSAPHLATGGGSDAAGR